MPEILYQDASVVVCVKPVGALSQGTGAQTLPELLKAQLGGGIYPVHRLDQPVGGVMVYARTPQAAAALSASMQAESSGKIYLAVTEKAPAAPEGTLCDLLFFDRSRNKSYPVRRRRAGVKDARLHYRVVAAAEGLTLVRVQLETGRTHQIRVQFASRGMPLLGDGKYGSRDKRCTAALWSAELRFVHPLSGQAMHFTAAPPEQFPWTLFSYSL